MKIVVPMPLNLANSRMHWKKKNRVKQDYWALLNTLKGTTNIVVRRYRSDAVALGARPVKHQRLVEPRDHAAFSCLAFVAIDNSSCRNWRSPSLPPLLR